jgi:hypothetical protein
MDRTKLVGKWRRVQGAAPYPEALTFRANGLYEADRDPNAYTVWDAGIFRLEDDHSLTLSTANDAEITYGLEMSDDTVEIRDGEGHVLRYERE